MLIAKGYRVSFVIENGRKVSAPAAYALLHDPSGSGWPKCSGLVAPFTKGGGEVARNSAGDARSYFGHDPKLGHLSAPPRNISAWKRVGVVNEILYSRRRPSGLPAKHAADYYHPFKGTATLYRRGRLLRLELHEGCVWNWRGLVRP